MVDQAFHRRAADAFFAHAVTPAVAVAPDGVIAACNAAAAQLLGRSRDDVVGASAVEILPGGADIAACARDLAAGEGSDARRTLSVAGPTGPMTVVIDRTDDGAGEVLVQLAPTNDGAGVHAALVRLKDDLARLNGVLKDRNADLERFAFIAAHDVQEPLRKISMLLDALERREGDALDPEVARSVARARGESQRARELVSGLLEHALAANGPCAHEPVDLSALLAELAERIFDEDAQGATVVLGEAPRVLGDRPLLAQLFTNLFVNAVKYRSEAPLRVEVSARADAGRVAVSVRDNGVGFDPADGEKMFQPFMRLHHGRASGSGIGLAICRQIAQRHGGRITATSTPGAGSVFTVELPLERADAAPRSREADRRTA